MYTMKECTWIQNLRAFALLEISSPIGLTLSPLLRLASFKQENLSDTNMESYDRKVQQLENNLT